MLKQFLTRTSPYYVAIKLLLFPAHVSQIHINILGKKIQPFDSAEQEGKIIFNSCYFIFDGVWYCMFLFFFSYMDSFHLKLDERSPDEINLKPTPNSH